tara:strand:+ start:378 stop:500 length:123 start_codon:yes stop_codon:yes gene_type:complete
MKLTDELVRRYGVEGAIAWWAVVGGFTWAIGFVVGVWLAG